MGGLGLSCNVEAGRLRVRGVVVSSGVAEEVFHHRSAANDDLALQLRSLHDAIVTRLADLEVGAVVVRAADHHGAARLTESAALRHRGEGTLLVAARSQVAVVACLSGKAIGEVLGMSKADSEAQAASLLTPSAAEATAAGLAAERLVAGPDGEEVG